jgi:hypothetical protein
MVSWALVKQVWRNEKSQSKKLFSFPFFILLFLALALVAGCSSESDLYQPHEVDTQAEAGSTQFTVLSVLRWSDYVSALSPAFKYSGTQAVADAIPTTQAEEDDLLQAFTARLQIATPTFSSSGSSTTSGGTGVPTVNKFTNTNTSASGNTANVPADTTSVLTQTVNPGPFTGIPGKSTLGIDPMLKYQTATAINEEVQLLNVELNSPLFSQYDAYIVRGQITTTPLTLRTKLRPKAVSRCNSSFLDSPRCSTGWVRLVTLTSSAATSLLL